MPFITSIGTAVPENKFDQSIIAKFMERLITDEAQRRKMHAVFRSSAISKRHSVLTDYGETSNFSFYPNTEKLEPFPSTAQRMEAYKKYACSLSMNAIRDCIKQSKTQDITHLITVSCTGMYAPGLDIDIVTQLGLSSSTERICINFMGCYAAVNALRVANAISGFNDKARILIVCTELCSLHFQKDFTEDNILANALFADGSAAILVESKPASKINLSLENFHSDIARNDEHHMAWTIGNLGFEMRLSSYVPEILKNGVKKLLLSLTDKMGNYLDRVQHFAIHPGGKKILEAVEQELNLNDQRLKPSFEVLKNFGNMSSPSVIFVLKEIYNKLTIENNEEQIIGMAFGPGITLESVLLKVCAG